MWALEVRPVAPCPAVAGIWRRDHRGLRRVSRDGVGSDPRCSRPASRPSRGGRRSPRRFVASDSALRAVLPCRPAPPRLRCVAVRPFRTSSLGVVKGPLPCPPVPPLGVRTVAGPSVGPGSRPWWLRLAPPGSHLRVPVGRADRRTRVFAPPSTPALCSRSSRGRGGHLFRRVRTALLPPVREMRSLAARARGMPLPPLQRPVLVVSHDLDGVTALGPSYLAASPCLRFAASPRPPVCSSLLAVLGSHPLQLASPPDLASQVSCPRSRRCPCALLLPILGFIEFPVPVPPGAAPLGAALPKASRLPLDALLPLGAFTPCRCFCSPALPSRCSPGSGLPGPAFAAACLAVHASARPSRRWIHAPGAPASLASTRSRRRGLSATRTRFRSPHRSRVASSGAGRLRVSAPLSSLLDLRVLPQVADRPAAPALVRRRSRSLASGVLPGLVLMRGRDRSPHPSVPLVHRRSPSGSHPGALVPVSRATHSWAASSPRGGRLQHLGGVASTHRPLPEGGVPCRPLLYPGDCSWVSSPRPASLSVRAPVHLSAVLRSPQV